MSNLLEVMADGIGDLTFANSDWVNEAREVLTGLVARHAGGLNDLGTFTMCEVAHNPPAYLHVGTTLAWYAKFDGGSVKVGSRELPDSECDFKLHGDHSIMSNLARIQHHGKDPRNVALAEARLSKLSRWEISGSVPEHKVLGAVMQQFHDTMAVRTMPRFTFMTPEWVSTARHIISTRAAHPNYAPGILDTDFKFSEEFNDTPAYAFPDGSHGGFWVHCSQGQVTVGAGPLPEHLEPADVLTKGTYTPVVPVGRTVNAAMTDEEKEEQKTYSATALRFDKEAGRRPVEQSQPSGNGPRFDKEAGSRPVEQSRPSGNGPMPPGLGRAMRVLHDELSMRSSSELPCDFDDTLKPEWSLQPVFDRDPGFESWVTYDKFDIYGNPRN